MRTVLTLIILFGLAAGLSTLAKLDSGYVMFVIPPYRAQVSTNLVVVALVLFFVAGYLLVRLLRRTASLPGDVGNFRERRRDRKASAALRESLRLHFEGHNDRALKLAKKAWKHVDYAPVAALVAARAAQSENKSDESRQWLMRATESDPSSKLARLMTEAEFAVASLDYDRADARLRQLRDMGHHETPVLLLSLKVASAKQRWQDVLRLTRQLQRNRQLDPSMAASLLREAHLAVLRECGDNPEVLESVWQNIPAIEARDRLLVEEAVPILVDAGLARLARRRLELLIDEKWDSELVELYAMCGQAEPAACLSRAEHWLLQNPQDPALLATLGKLCIDNEIWGKGESYLEASLNLRPSVSTHLAMARLLEKLERADEAQTHYRAAATMSSQPKALRQALPKPMTVAEDAEAVEVSDK